MKTLSKAELLQRINSVAKELQKQGETFTRGELAYQLSDAGVTDSLELEENVYEAYTKYHFSPNVFVSNDHHRPLTESYEIQALALSDFGRAEQTLDQRMQETSRALRKAQDVIRVEIAKAVVSASTDIMSQITGTSGIQKAQQQAEVMFGKYSSMIGVYQKARSYTEDRISDFTVLRGDIQKQYIHFASALTDIFGDKIRVIAPQLFDFTQIEWLDTDAMHNNMQLEYNTITSKCGELLSGITESFGNSLRSSSETYRQVGDKRVGLALAALNMFGHYSRAYEKTNELKSDLLRLEKAMIRDKAHVESDLLRVLAIYKKLNDNFIPQAFAFHKYSEELLQSGIQEMLDSLYANPEARKRKQQREEIISQLQNCGNDIEDKQSHIRYYEQHISECTQMLNGLKNDYTNAKDTMPHKPFFLFDWFTLGSLGRSYRRELYEWSQRCMPVVQSYEDLQVDVKLDNEDLKRYKQELKTDLRRHKQLREELTRINEAMMAMVVADERTQRQMAKSLKDILRLLSLAKEVVQSKLDEQLTKKVHINEIEDIQLPAEVNEGIDTLISSIQADAQVDIYDAAEIVDVLGDTEAKPGDKGYEREDLEAVANKSNELLQQGVNICRQMIELQKQKLNNANARLRYDEQLENLRHQFQERYADIDKRGDELLKVMAELNAATDREQVREALLKLADGKLPIPSDEEINAFLRGEKQITI